jgi:hypothetical protein
MQLSDELAELLARRMQLLADPMRVRILAVLELVRLAFRNSAISWA